MSTLMPSSATARNTVAATPGRSGTSSSVTFASSVSIATPEIMACSISLSSISWTHVPGSSEKDERTWSRTPWRRAYSTERSCSTFEPAAASSSMSS